tara:strand:- start:133 stop:372 length:240 start_codon:yes stop_codon:yes gene_type:complete
MFRVIIPDYRGRILPESNPGSQNYHPTMILKDLRHQLAGLDLHQFVAIRTSHSGVPGMAFGLIMSSAIEDIVLNYISLR